MSSNFQSTERGGDSSYDQYTSQSSGLNAPHSKSGGQLGSTSTSENQQDAQQQRERGERTAENMRYGQAISEEGMGGKTEGLGEAGTEVGYGGAGAQDDEAAAGGRREQGYGGGREMRGDVGA
ncbi:hypothetical protein K461DRAFT_312268 [Myriangium duriaei CBS 260.36]|uniref:Uncharacterized protein n=1 Tax=Myriangium duriaei CBS 260.36 TaxID=1168546 RepID=A0A9P4MLL4_9PEZI|nr:hypothetical protein K461DRAFT_312268 [Myriangium duriaei CBS 260.36]